MKYCLILTLLLSFSCLANKELIDLNIKQAEIWLENKGWKSLPLQCEDEDIEIYWSGNEAPKIFKSGITSIHACSGTGSNSCGFYYQKVKVVNLKIIKNCLKLVTTGEFSFKGSDSLIVKKVINQCPEEC